MVIHFKPATPAPRLWTVGAVLLLLLLLPGAMAMAEEQRSDPRWNIGGWTPSLTLVLGVHSTEISGFVIATDSSDTPIREPDFAEKHAVTGMFHVSAGIETPELPGRIRLFGNIDYFVTFPPDRQAAGEGDPSGFFIQPGVPNPSEIAIKGTGSKVRIKTNRSAYGFTGGVSIPIEIAGVEFSLKPGVSWMRYTWDMQGVVLDAIKPANVFGRDFRAIELRARGKLYSHGVGPYLGIEIEPDDWGPVLVSAYVEAAYYRTLGDQDADISDSATISGNSLPTDTYLARWGIGVEDQFWRAGVGIRMYLKAD